MYENEKGVGEGVRASGLDRGEVFVTSKLSNAAHRPDDARAAFDDTLAALGSDYVDLFLIHWPLPTLYDGDFVSTWQTLEEFYRDGRARSIGVSNFQVPHLRRLAAETEVVPAVNQIEVHPYFTNDEVRGVRRGARHPDRGLVADRPGRGAGRSDDHRHRRAGRQDARPGHAALAHPAGRHRLPEVDDPVADQGELRRSSTSSWTTTTWRRSARWTRERTAGTAATPTSSRTFRASNPRGSGALPQGGRITLPAIMAASASSPAATRERAQHADLSPRKPISGGPARNAV